MIRGHLTILLSVCALAVSSCEEPIGALTPPGLDGPLTDGKWETLGRKSIQFWPPSAERTQLPELISFACQERTRGQVRVTVTGDTRETGIWIAGTEIRERTLLLETSAGVTELKFAAGDELLPFIVVKTDTDWLQPLLTGEGTFAINAYGQRTYRIPISPKLATVVGRCGKPA